jgi:hypothetical protein
MEGNIVYTSSSVTSLVNTQPSDAILLIYIFGAEVRLCKVINGAWTLTQILATYNTQETDECYNNGTFNVNDIQATWGGNCNSQGFNVQPNNVVSYIVNNYNAKINSFSMFKFIPVTNLFYNIGTNGVGNNLQDVAYGCPKNFSINYKCGNAAKSENMPGETWSENANINCGAEFTNCMSILIITDEGYIYICKIKDATITNNNFAKINDNATIFYTWDFSDKIDQPNNSLTNKSNFIAIGAILTPDTYISSPNKKLVMTCDKTTVELIILTYSENTVKVNDIEYGLNNTSAVYEITNLPTTNNIGKIAWINSMGLRKEYPAELLEKSDDYDTIPGWRSPGNDIYMTRMTVEDGKNWCNNNSECAGFEYTNGICYFKNENMYPKGTRQANLGGSQLYIRKNKIKSNGSTCNKKLNNIDNLTWEHYIPDIFNGIFMTNDYNCNDNLLNPSIETTLNNNKDNLITQINNLDSSIFEQTKQLLNNTTGLNEENNFLYNSMKENFENSNTTNQLNNITYLNTLLSNSKKFVIQKSYIIIILLTILLGLIIVLYKIKK